MKVDPGLADGVKVRCERKIGVKDQYFGHLMPTADSLEKTLILGKMEGRRRGQRRMRWLGDIINSMVMSLSILQEMLKDLTT